MIDVFRSLKSLTKIRSNVIDSTIFRLHYNVSVTFMLAFSVIVTTRQYVGNPIDCIHTKDIPEDVLNTYCWIHSTYTIPSAFWKRVGLDVAHPGIDKTVDPDERRFVKYYQWVTFCLFMQVRKNLLPKMGSAVVFKMLPWNCNGFHKYNEAVITTLTTHNDELLSKCGSSPLFFFLLRLLHN